MRFYQALDGPEGKELLDADPAVLANTKIGMNRKDNPAVQAYYDRMKAAMVTKAKVQARTQQLKAQFNPHVPQPAGPPGTLPRADYPASTLPAGAAGQGSALMSGFGAMGREAGGVVKQGVQSGIQGVKAGVKSVTAPFGEPPPSPTLQRMEEELPGEGGQP